MERIRHSRTTRPETASRSKSLLSLQMKQNVQRMRQQSMVRQNYEQMLSDLGTFYFKADKLHLHEKVLQLY